jgi:hypothetical protein
MSLCADQPIHATFADTPALSGCVGESPPVRVGLPTSGPQGVQGPQGIQGEQGVQGPQGIQGVPGPPGVSYLHEQPVSIGVWTIPHNLDLAYPDVILFDATGKEFKADILFLDNNTVRVTVNPPTAGWARIS